MPEHKSGSGAQVIIKIDGQPSLIPSGQTTVIFFRTYLRSAIGLFPRVLRGARSHESGQGTGFTYTRKSSQPPRTHRVWRAG